MYMDKASKDLGLLYEKMNAPVRQNTINESVGDMVFSGVKQIAKYLLGIGEGVPGITNRFFILRNLSNESFQKYRDLENLGHATNQFLAYAKKIKNQSAAARMSFYSAELAKMRPTFNKLEINPTLLDESFKANKVLPNLQKALNAPVIHLVNVLSFKTGLPTNIIDQVLNESSANTATQLLKQYMPVMANVNKDALRLVGISLGGLLIWNTVQLASKVFGTGGKVLVTTGKGFDALGRAAEVTTTVITGAESGLKRLNETIEEMPGFGEPDDQSAPTPLPSSDINPFRTTPVPTPLPSSDINPFI